VPYVMPGCGHTYHQYTIKVPAERRAAIQEAMTSAGIQTQVYYPEPLHRQPCFAGIQELPEAAVQVDAVVPMVLSLPMSYRVPLSAAPAVHDILTVNRVAG
jgi:UDP-2-acetamido-2-deoxy-ribo-hexuluronate aminotransferase